MFNLKPIVIAHALAGLSLAANDWSTACTSGKCSYESGDGVNSAWSTIDVAGSASVLSDITSAAGWTVSDCSSTWASGVANVQLACEGSAAQTALCTHLLDGGASNKIVRLPQDCGVGPFARVVNSTEIDKTHFAVALDYDFSQLPQNTAQTLSFTISASNIKDSAAGTILRARHNLPRRAYPIAVVPRFDASKTVTAPPISFSKSFSLIDQTFDCPAADGGVGVSGSLSVDAHVALDAKMAFSISVKGDILPFPKIDSMALTGTLTGSAGATFDVVAGIKGTFDTGEILLFQAGLPALNLPGIMNIGPQFVLNTQLEAELELQAKVRAGATYMFPEVKLVFPESAGKSAASIEPVPDALKLSLEPQVTADGSVTAHLIPRIEFGVEVLGGLAEASIFLQVDGTARLGVNAEASAVLSPGEDAQTAVNGCVNLGAGVAVTAGAVGAIPGIFDKQVDFDIFRRDFDLFERCFGQPAKRSVHARRALPSSAVAKRQLACPSPGEGGILTNVLNLVRQ